MSALLPSRRTIYLSGPVSGVPEKNDPLFAAVTARLRAMGHRVYSPRERPWDGARSAFADYCAFICAEADTIVMLPGWRQSHGASCEHSLAECVGIEIIEWSAWEEALSRQPEDVSI